MVPVPVPAVPWVKTRTGYPYPCHSLDVFGRVCWQESGAGVRVDTVSLLACVDTTSSVFGGWAHGR